MDATEQDLNPQQKNALIPWRTKRISSQVEIVVPRFPPQVSCDPILSTFGDSQKIFFREFEQPNQNI